MYRNLKELHLLIGDEENIINMSKSRFKHLVDGKNFYIGDVSL